MAINFKKPACLTCHTNATLWNWLTSLWCHPLITWSPFNPEFIFSFRLLQKLNIAMIGQVKGRWQSYAFSDNLGHKGWKNSFYTHFAPPHPCAMLTKHFHLTQVFILPFSNIGRGNGGAGTYSLGITVMSLCFWHFPTQFVPGFGSSDLPTWE